MPTLSVLENLLLGSHGGTGRLDLAAGRARFSELAGLLGVDFAPDARAGGLALGQQQQVEIMKALWREGSRLLILDEPTSMLTPQGYEELRSVLVNLKREGLAVILITHKLHEAIELGDRVTVLRAGRVVGSLAPGDLRGRSEAELSARIVEIMFGEEAAELADAVEVEATPCGAGCRGASSARSRSRSRAGARRRRGRGRAARRHGRGPGRRDRRRRGVDGNGQRELAELIAGQRSPRAGEVLLFGEDVTRLGVGERERRGLRYITDDRIGEGMVADLDVATNAVLKRIGRRPFWRAGTERRDEIDRFAEGLVERFNVRTRRPHPARDPLRRQRAEAAAGAGARR